MMPGAKSGATVSGKFRIRDKDGNIKEEGEILPETFIHAENREELERKLKAVEEELARAVRTHPTHSLKREKK
jgi:hypothetical protein